VPEIRQIGIQEIRSVPQWARRQSSSTALPPPITSRYAVGGFPIVEMPGCVRMWEDSTKSSELVFDDESGTIILCDGPVPTLESMAVDWGALTYGGSEEEKPSQLEPPQIVPPISNKKKKSESKKESKDDQNNQEQGSAELPLGDLNLNNVLNIDLFPCPRPDDLSVGSKGKFGRARVKDHKLNADNECITLWEEIPVLETVNTYLPPPPLILTTGAVAATAVTASVLVKPLSDYLLKIIKPAVKKIFKRVLAKLGKKQKVLSVFERRKLQKLNR